MMLQQYRIRSIDDNEKDDTEFNFKTTAFGPDDAVQDWCRWMDSQSNFVDGYPNQHEVEVIAPEGNVTRLLVSTDWSPEFYSWPKGE